VARDRHDLLGVASSVRQANRGSLAQAVR